MFSKYLNTLWQEAYSLNTKNIQNLLEENKNAVVLDVGCGDGQKTLEFKKKLKSENIIGIDGVKPRLLAAKKRGISKIVVSNLEKKWPFEDNSFDVVISNQVIEHLLDIDNFISEIYRVLKPDGYAVISTENLASWHNIGALILGFQDFSHHLIKRSHVGNPMSPHFGQRTVTWSKKDNSGVDDTAFPHIKIFTLKSLANVFKAFGFKEESKLGSGYYPLFGMVSKFFSYIDPYHSHFICLKVTKPF